MLNGINTDFTLIAIGSAFCAAIANIFARTLLKKFKAKDFMGMNFLIMGVTLVLISPLFYFFEATPLSMGILISIGLIDTLANYFYFKTFEKTEATIATPILSLAPAFTFLFSWMILDEVVSLKTYLIALLIIITVIIFPTDFKNFKRFQKTTLIPALLAALLFGLSAIPTKFLLDSLGAINAPTLYMFRAGFIALFSLLLFPISIKTITSNQFRMLFIRGLFVIAQWLLLYFALTKGNAGVTLTLANITPIFVFILGAIFLSEKITLRKGIAAVLILVLSFLI